MAMQLSSYTGVVHVSLSDDITNVTHPTFLLEKTDKLSHHTPCHSLALSSKMHGETINRRS